MENTPSAPGPAGAKDILDDPVKNQGILRTLIKKERATAKEWPNLWSFYKDLPQIRIEEAIKLGMTKEEYCAAVAALNCQPEPKKYPVKVDPSPAPLPVTSSGIIGRRAKCPLERYGRLVRTERDYPIRPPLPPNQVYDPYKQTFIFLGIDCGDPISYKLPPSQCEVPEHILNQPLCPDVMPLSYENLQNINVL